MLLWFNQNLLTKLIFIIIYNVKNLIWRIGEMVNTSDFLSDIQGFESLIRHYIG